MMKYLKMPQEEWTWDLSSPLRDTLRWTEKNYAHSSGALIYTSSTSLYQRSN
jgi:hypothetical protein